MTKWYIVVVSSIRRSKSPWVRKKSEELRMCIDYRQLNQRTVKDVYAKPWPEPRTPEKVRRFLGFIGYYRKFIQK
jgi:hypothetical protein